MSFKNDLGALITNADEQNTLWRALLQSIYDHGGSRRHLDRLLFDAKQEKVLTDQIAKLVVGPIWKLVEESVDLGLCDDDFKCPVGEFEGRYSNIDVCLDRDAVLKRESGINPHARHPDDNATRPKKPCRYRLHYPGHGHQHSDLDDIDHASWRELVAYLSLQKDFEICPFLIIAAGLQLPRFGENGTSFPNARQNGNRPVVMWQCLNYATQHGYFYLVRVYD